MSTIMARSPANQDRPLLIHPSRPSSDQRRFRTLLDLLTIEKMDGGDHTVTQDEDEEEEEGNNNISRWKNLRERLGLKAIGCCGIATWRCENLSPPEGENDAVREEESATRQQDRDNEVGAGVGPTPINDGMNLGAALAAERQFSAEESSGSYGVDEGINGGGGLATPSRVSLMRLLEETSDGCELERDRSKGGGEERERSDSDSVCCVCMGRKKGAAFIPCGHTYCRVCSRELWLNRGSCPLCNRSILEILDIF